MPKSRAIALHWRGSLALAGAILAVWAILLAPTAARAAEERRVALVIGNSAYQHVTALTNPANDAKLMAGVLSALGFELVGGAAQLDLDKPALAQAIRTFGASLRPGSVALFYYSGHGLQVDGVNYLVPIDANPNSLADVDPQMVDAGRALQAMQQSGAALNVFILDACRNNPFGGRGLRSPGLAEMHAPHGTIISYATQPGGLASDGVAGARDSPYTAALAQALRSPGLEVVKAFNEVGLLVAHATNDAQEPWLALSPLDHDFFLAGREPGSGPPVLTTEAATDRDGAPTRGQHPAMHASNAQAAVASADSPSCPPAGTTLERSGGVAVVYAGHTDGNPDACLATIGGRADASVLGLFPAAWDGAGSAAAAIRQATHGGPGGTAVFDAPSRTGTLWRFTVVYEGQDDVMLQDIARPARRIVIDQRDVPRPAEARIRVWTDVTTGAVLRLATEWVNGNENAYWDYWSRYGGGPRAVPDFQATRITVPAR